MCSHVYKDDLVGTEKFMREQRENELHRNNRDSTQVYRQENPLIEGENKPQRHKCLQADQFGSHNGVQDLQLGERDGIM